MWELVQKPMRDNGLIKCHSGCPKRRIILRPSRGFGTVATAMSSALTRLSLAVAATFFLVISPVHASTWTFDISVNGYFSSNLPLGTIDVTSTGVVTVSLPTDYSINEFALNLVGGTVNSNGAYTVTTGAQYYGSNPIYGPFNTILDGRFGNTLTFAISNYAGIFSLVVDNQPIWFAADVTKGFSGQTLVADAAIVTPLPGALPLFATGLGTLGLLGWRRKKKAQANAA